ncbi:unnamed protein product [Rotaria sp. Silwood1]|nr:unnamed protein product [Rotaria sp. Silwood1]CAF5152947.1 unnamed protein product [Rotaria sp. Silwood1]
MKKRTLENKFLSVDDLNEDEEEDDALREELDMHLVIVSINNFIYKSFLTAKQVINEIDFMLEYMIPDLGNCDDLLPLRMINIKAQSIYSLNGLNEELNKLFKDLSNLLVQELAIQDELEDEKEMKKYI